MKHDELEPPPDILARAFEAERDRVDDDPAARAAALRAVERAVVLSAPPAPPSFPKAPAAPAPAAAVPAFSAKALALAVGLAFAGGAVVGGAVVAAVGTSSPPPKAIHVVADAEPGVVDANVVAPDTSILRIVDVNSIGHDAGRRSDPEVATSDASASNGRAGAEADLGRERELIDVARTALTRGHADVALDAVERHRRAFPAGKLREERDAIRVQALAAAGRNADAEEAAKHFHRVYPASLLSDVVDIAIAKPRGP